MRTDRSKIPCRGSLKGSMLRTANSAYVVGGHLDRGTFFLIGTSSDLAPSSRRLYRCINDFLQQLADIPSFRLVRAPPNISVPPTHLAAAIWEPHLIMSLSITV